MSIDLSQTSSFVSFKVTLHEFTENDKCKFNVFVNEHPESTSSYTDKIITDDMESFTAMLPELSIIIPVDFKPITLSNYT